MEFRRLRKAEISRRCWEIIGVEASGWGDDRLTQAEIDRCLCYEDEEF